MRDAGLRASRAAGCRSCSPRIAAAWWRPGDVGALAAALGPASQALAGGGPPARDAARARSTRWSTDTSSSTRRSRRPRSRDRLLRPSPGRRARHPCRRDRRPPRRRAGHRAQLASATRRLARALASARPRRRSGRRTRIPTAGGALHWAPSGHPGLRERMAQIAAWVATHAPRLVVVDVSVEVTVLLRTMGVPTVVMGMPGARHDRCAPARLPARRRDHRARGPPGRASLGGGAPWRAKTHPVGAISRFDGRRPARERAPVDARGSSCFPAAAGRS